MDKLLSRSSYRDERIFFLKWFSVTLRSFFLLGLFTLQACSDDNVNTANHYNSKNIFSYTLVKIDSIVLQDNNNFVFGSFKDAAYWKNKIFIADHINNTVWIFDENYKIIKKIGRKGRGPGEFISSPHIVTTPNKIVFTDHYGKKVEVYNDRLEHIKTSRYPKEIYIQPKDWIYTYEAYIMWALTPGKRKNFYNEKSAAALNQNFELERQFLEWLNPYNGADTYSIYNTYLTLSNGSDETFFVLQGAHFDNFFQIDKNFNIIKTFGTYPKGFKAPPENIKVEEVASSFQATAEYVAQITKVFKMDYDSTNHLLFCNYVNYTEEANYLRTAFLGDHFIQVYNENYDSVFEGEIDGPLMFIHDSKIYVIASEEPDNVKIIIYKLTPNES